MIFQCRAGVRNFKMKITDRVNIHLCIAFKLWKWIEVYHICSTIIDTANGSKNLKSSDAKASQRIRKCPFRQWKETPIVGFNQSCKTSSQYGWFVRGRFIPIIYSIDQLGESSCGISVYSDAYILTVMERLKTFTKRLYGTSKKRVRLCKELHTPIEHNYICSPTVHSMRRKGGRLVILPILWGFWYPPGWQENTQSYFRPYLCFSDACCHCYLTRYKSKMLLVHWLFASTTTSIPYICIRNRIYELACFIILNLLKAVKEEIGMKGITFTIYKFWLKTFLTFPLALILQIT
jgi:hypothetical protein